MTDWLRLLRWWRPSPQWPLLTGMPTVQFRVVALTVLDFFTLNWGVYLSLRVSSINGTIGNAVFDSWLLFLAGMHGFSLGSYVAKRTTSWDGNVSEDHSMNANSAPADVAPQPPPSPVPPQPQPTPAPVPAPVPVPAPAPQPQPDPGAPIPVQ